LFADDGLGQRTLLSVRPPGAPDGGQSHEQQLEQSSSQL
jgi:hypothetical protein